MILAALGVVLADTLQRINALKQLVSLVVNVAAAGLFLASGRIDWTLAAVMAGAALVGGAIGGRLASRVPARALRRIIVVLGVAIAIVYFVKMSNRMHRDPPSPSPLARRRRAAPRPRGRPGRVQRPARPPRPRAPPPPPPARASSR